MRPADSLPGSVRPVLGMGAGNVPAPVTELLGREGDLDRVVDALRRGRVVTVTGPGGVGKTRLALAAAARLAEPGGSWVVDLAALDRGERLAEAVLTVLGVDRGPQRSVIDRVVEFLRPLRVLVVFDNCEHVAGAAAAVIEAVTQGCPEVTVLATSREPLAVDGEHVYPLAPLGLPPARVGELADVKASAAVRLFVQRATAAQPGFALDVGNAQQVVDLCRHLDGLPLALELAAPKLRALSLADIVDRLDARFSLLSGGRRTAPPRHQTLRAVVAWSYELLDEPDRWVFDRLGVFAGTFTASAAEAVASDRDGALDVAVVVARLVDRSMVTAQVGQAPTRYALLETLREYARERLADREEETAARRAHAEYFAAMAHRADAGQRGPGEGTWVDELVRSLGDLRAAHRWAVRGDLPVAARLSAGLVWFAKFHQLPEVAMWAEETAEEIVRHPEIEVPGAAAVFGSAAAGARARGDHGRAAELAARGVAAGESTGDPGRRYPVTVLSGLALFQGRLDEADRWGAQAAGLALDAADEAWAAHAVANRSLAHTYRGDTQNARRLAQQAAALATRTGNPTARGWAWYAAAEAASGEEPDEAIRLLDDTRAVALSCGNRYLAGVALVSGAALRGRHGDPRAALRSLSEVMEHWRRAGNWVQQWTTVRNIVELLVQINADEPAAVLDAAVESRATSTAAFGEVADRLHLARDRLRNRLGQDVFRVATERGAGLSDDQVVIVARTVIADVLGDDHAGRRSGTPGAVTGSDARPAVFSLDGAVWSLTFQGRTVWLPDMKGLHDLAELVRRPGTQVRCTELMGSAVQAADTGPTIDQEARLRYRSRITELQAQLADAQDAQDQRSADRARLELDALIDHLSAATDRHGRSRRSGQPKERARSAVSWRIRAAIRRISTADPDLGQHLQDSVRTGTWCSYQPATPVRWQL
jgi:predicted ATPase